MILEHTDVPLALVGAAVEREWGVAVSTVEHVEVGADAWHWVLGDDGGPQWFATLEAVSSVEDRQVRLAAYEAAARLGRQLSFVVAPALTRDGTPAVGLAPGLLLTVTPFLEGTTLDAAALAEDPGRSDLATMMGDLHRSQCPAVLPLWRPGLGRGSDARRADLERCLTQDEWSGGPWSGPAGRLVADARPVLLGALRRLALLGAAVAGHADRWVVTHGETHSGHLVRTPDGDRLVGWGTAARAPRERDLGAILDPADVGQGPWFAYLEAGGSPEPLSTDTVELFALQRHLSRVAEHAVRLSRPHEDTADERRRFGRLEEELTVVLARWA